MAMFSYPFDYGHWVIEQLEDEGRLHATPFAEAELVLLRTDLMDVMASDTDMRPTAFGLNNRVVPMLRGRIVRQKLVPGVHPVRVRRGLTLPSEWHEAYSVIYGSQLPWLISGILQNTLLNNAWAGERKPWKSK